MFYATLARTGQSPIMPIRRVAPALLRDFKGDPPSPLLPGGATPLTEIIREGQLSILMLPSSHRAGLPTCSDPSADSPYYEGKGRSVTDTQSSRPADRVFQNRTRANLGAGVATLIPRTVLAIDEAQEWSGTKDTKPDERWKTSVCWEETTDYRWCWPRSVQASAP